MTTQPDQPEPVAQITRYEVSVLPEGDINRSLFTINVEHRGEDRWAVVRHQQCMNAKGEWSWERVPSEREDEWLAEHRFDRVTAIELAKWAAPRIVVNGHTAVDAYRHTHPDGPAARPQGPEMTNATEETPMNPPTDAQLDEIAGRAASLYEYATLDDAPFQADADQLTGTDVPALIADLRRARDRVAELEAHAYGCDAEGCVLPHSSWCDAAKKTAAANNGCTCGQPWTGHPQPHAMHCWTVNPPRAEVEEMRKRIAELTA